MELDMLQPRTFKTIQTNEYTYIKILVRLPFLFSNKKRE